MSGKALSRLEDLFELGGELTARLPSSKSELKCVLKGKGSGMDCIQEADHWFATGRESTLKCKDDGGQDGNELWGRESRKFDCVAV